MKNEKISQLIAIFKTLLQWEKFCAVCDAINFIQYISLQINIPIFGKKHISSIIKYHPNLFPLLEGVHHTCLKEN